jgi:hypothetical protein
VNDNSTWLVLVGLVGVALGVLFLSAGMPVDTASATADTVPVLQTQAESDDKSCLYTESYTAPVVEAGDSLTLRERERALLEGHAENVGEGAVSYYWSAEGRRGYFDNAFQKNAVYTAPSICGCEECVTITLTVTDAKGTRASDQLCVRVLGDPLSCRPLRCRSLRCRSLPANRICQEQSRWCVAEPSPVRTYECPSTTAPCESPCIPHISATPTCCEMPLPCCSDPCGYGVWQPSWLGEQIVSAPGSLSPLILRRYPDAINEGAALELHGTVSNPTCASVCFCWKADKGWFEDADTLMPIYHAPMSDRYGGEDATITLAIYDEAGGYAYDQIRIHINNLEYCCSPEASLPEASLPEASLSNNWLMRAP